MSSFRFRIRKRNKQWALPPLPAAYNNNKNEKEIVLFIFSAGYDYFRSEEYIYILPRENYRLF